MKRSKTKSLTHITSNSKFSFSKFHHNHNFYNWVAAPSMFGSPSQWRCYLGNYVVRYRGFESCVW